MPEYTLYTPGGYVGTYTADQLAEVIANLTEDGEITLRVIPAGED